MFPNKVGLGLFGGVTQLYYHEPNFKQCCFCRYKLVFCLKRLNEKCKNNFGCYKTIHPPFQSCIFSMIDCIMELILRAIKTATLPFGSVMLIQLSQSLCSHLCSRRFKSTSNLLHNYDNINLLFTESSTVGLSDIQYNRQVISHCSYYLYC